VWGVVCGVWGVGCGVWGVGCGVWVLCVGVVCGVWCVVCGVWVWCVGVVCGSGYGKTVVYGKTHMEVALRGGLRWFNNEFWT